MWGWIEPRSCHHHHISFLGDFFGVSIKRDFIKLEVPLCSFIPKGANASNRAWVFIIDAKFAIALGEEHTRLGFAFGKEGNCFDKLGFAKELETSTIGIWVSRVLLWNGVKIGILDKVINWFLITTINHEQAQ